MYILVVEDDYLQADPIHYNLKRAFPRARIDFLRTELEFRSFFESDKEELPDVVILDVMLRWTNPSKKMTPRPTEWNMYRAGFRCEKFLGENEKTKDTQVVLYTFLEHADLEEDLKSLRPKTVYMVKEADTENLIQFIRELPLPENVT